MIEDKAIAIESAIRQSKTIVITSHRNPDGDAIGSTLGLYHLAKALTNASLRVILPDPVPYFLDHLPNAGIVEAYNSGAHDELIATCDCLVVCDLNRIERLGTLGNAVNASTGVRIRVDHHLDADSWPTIDAIDTESSSTCELVARLAIALQVPFTKEMAECLYTGIMTDSGGFRFERTDAGLLRIAALLLEAGADPVYLSDRVFNRYSRQRLTMLGRALSQMQFFQDDALAVIQLRESELTQYGLDLEDIEGIVSYTLMIEDVAVGALITELTSGEVKVSLRSKGHVAAVDIAKALGGGGHKHAAGARVAGIDTAAVREKVVELAALVLNPKV